MSTLFCVAAFYAKHINACAAPRITVLGGADTVTIGAFPQTVVHTLQTGGF